METEGIKSDILLVSFLWNNNGEGGCGYAEHDVTGAKRITRLRASWDSFYGVACDSFLTISRIN